MNQAAIEVMKGVQGAKLAYVQSDEISILLDSRNPESDAFFGGRIEKLLSIVPGIAAGTFGGIFLAARVLHMLSTDNFQFVLSKVEGCFFMSAAFLMTGVLSGMFCIRKYLE